MGYDKERLSDIWHRTNGKCHICPKHHRLRDYGVTWEVDHSNPRANGGGDSLNNLLVACISCNRSKQASSNRTVRAANGVSGKPPSTDEVKRQRQQTRVWKGVGIAALVVGTVLAVAKILAKLKASQATA